MRTRSKKKDAADNLEGHLDLFGRPSIHFAIPVADERIKEARTAFSNVEEDTTSDIDFSEVMEGNLYIGDDIDDFEIARNAAKDSGHAAHFCLSVRAWDTEICESLCFFPRPS